MNRPDWYGEPRPEHRQALAAMRALPAGPAFTEALSAAVPDRSVSAVIATYNRCPFDPAERLTDNPLVWSVTSLIRQAGGALREILVVDDGSSDYTSAVLEQLGAAAGDVVVRAVRLRGHRGAWFARNTAVRRACSPLLCFGDDDCVFAPHAVLGAAHVLALLRRTDPAAAVVNTPFYYRAMWPDAVLPTGRIGVLDVERADFATGFHALPASHLATEFPKLGPAGVFVPLPVQLIGGCGLVDADALMQAGGFADVSAWRSGYSDHLHLAADLTDSGAHLYHCPDPRLGAAHLKFGAVGAYPAAVDDGDRAVPGLGRSFADLVRLSALPRDLTGHRVRDPELVIEWLGSFFAFFADRSLPGGRRWALRTWSEFVVEGRRPSLALRDVPPQAERARAWRAGMSRGAAFLTTRARPARGRGEVAALLGEVTDACGQPPITGW